LRIFCAFGSSGYNDHDNLDNSYITTGYLDIDIKKQCLQQLKNSSQHRWRRSLASTPLSL
jgi:hypothetical protein